MRPGRAERRGQVDPPLAAAGLIRPTEGTLTVLGTSPAGARERFSYVAQNKPLPAQLTVAATLRLGAELNRARWDHASVERIAYGRHTPDPEGSLSPGARIRSLSGGQRTASPSPWPSASAPS